MRVFPWTIKTSFHVTYLAILFAWHLFNRHCYNLFGKQVSTLMKWLLPWLQYRWEQNSCENLISYQIDHCCSENIHLNPTNQITNFTAFLINWIWRKYFIHQVPSFICYFPNMLKFLFIQWFHLLNVSSPFFMRKPKQQEWNYSAFTLSNSA